MPVLNDLGQIERWRRFAPELPAMLHLDTGMNRLGLTPGETGALAAEPERLHGVTLAAILSHLACADEPDHPLNEAQRGAFAAALARLPAAPASLAGVERDFPRPARSTSISPVRGPRSMASTRSPATQSDAASGSTERQNPPGPRR